MSTSKPRAQRGRSETKTTRAVSQGVDASQAFAPSGTEMDPYGPEARTTSGARTRVAWDSTAAPGREGVDYGATQTVTGQPVKFQPQRKEYQSRRLTLAVLIFAPLIAFTLIMCLFALAYVHIWAFVWLTVVILFMAALLKTLRDLKIGAAKPGVFLGVLVLVATLSGSVLGLWLYHSQLAPYWAVRLGRVYTNLLPDEPAEAHADVGIINFAEGARVDTAQSASFTAGYKYCVAPVVGATLIDPDLQAVQYWAAGMDCCTPRSGFLCDEALEYSARSGVAIIDASGLTTAEKPYYLKAVNQSIATYGTLTAKEPVFVKWVEDPWEVQAGRWNSAMLFLVYSISAYLLLSTLLAGALHLGTPLKAHEIEEPVVGQPAPGSTRKVA